MTFFVIYSKAEAEEKVGITRYLYLEICQHYLNLTVPFAKFRLWPITTDNRCKSSDGHLNVMLKNQS